MAVIESSRRNSAAPSELPEIETGDELLEEDEPEGEEQHEDESPAVIKQRLLDWVEDPNIARHFDTPTLQKIADLVIREYEIDEQSRADWKDKAQKALDFATQKTEPKIYPWTDSSNVIFPLITRASIEFASRAYPAIVQNRNVVKGVVWGDDKGTPATQNGKADGAPMMRDDGSPIWLVQPGAKQKRATIIGEHMSWQLLVQMEFWEPQTDQLLHQMPIIGGAVRKTYRDAREDYNCSELVDLMNLVWNKNAPSFARAPRKSEIIKLYPHEIEELERSESFLEIIYGVGDVTPQDESTEDGPGFDPSDSQSPRVFIEQHRRYDLDNDGYAEPLIITVHKQTANVVRILARYDEDGIITDNKTGEIKRIEPVDYYTLYPFLPDPEGGSYPIGFGHLLKPLNEAINTTINQMFDAGHLAIAGGGFIGTGLSLPGGVSTFSIGEYKPVNTKGQNIRDSVFPIPFPGPSEVLFQLLGFLVQSAEGVAAIKDVLSGDVAMANTAPTTMVALVEQGLKVYTAIHKRIYRALKSEFDKLYRLNRLHLVEDERYRVGDTWREVTPDDYRLGGGVEPIADPTMVTDMQRLMRAALLKEEAKDNPLINPLVATRRYLEAAQIDRIDELIPDKMPPPQPPPDVALAQQELQLKVQTAQSKMGQERALELMQYTQAMLNFQKARTEMSGPQMEWMDKQLELMRMHIEALNTTVKAAGVDATVHGHAVSELGHRLAHHARMAAVAQQGKEIANEQPDQTGGPADVGGGGAAPADMGQPSGTGPDGGGIPAVAPQPGNSGLPAFPGPSQPGS